MNQQKCVCICACMHAWVSVATKLPTHIGLLLPSLRLLGGGMDNESVIPNESNIPFALLDLHGWDESFPLLVYCFSVVLVEEDVSPFQFMPSSQHCHFVFEPESRFKGAWPMICLCLSPKLVPVLWARSSSILFSSIWSFTASTSRTLTSDSS